MNIRKLKEDEVDLLIDLYTHYLSNDHVPLLSSTTRQEIWQAITLNLGLNYFVLELNHFNL